MSFENPKMIRPDLQTRHMKVMWRPEGHVGISATDTLKS